MTAASMTAPSRRRVLVVDDEPLVRELCQEVLESIDCEVSTAGNGRDALYQLLRQPFDLVILDLAMPIMDGTQTLERLRSFLPDVPVLILTAYGSIQSCVEHLKKGADMYLPKPFELDELESVVQALLSAPRSIEPFWERLHPPVRLTQREKTILFMMRDGLADQDIAEQLGLSVRTVQNHVGSILNKMGARNRTEAAAMSYRKDIL